MPRETEQQDNTIFQMTGQANAVQFAQADGDDKAGQVNLTLYDGSVVKHWYWGNLAFDLDSMKLAKPKIPILLDHMTNHRLGIGDKATFDGTFVLSGKFMESSEEAQQIRAQAKEGFPFESSLRFDPDKTIIEQIPEGQSSTCNGRTVKGPGAIMKNTVIMEGSVTTFGALTNTKSQIFEQPPNKEIPMDKITMTIDQFKQDQPDLYAKTVSDAKAEAEAALREDFARYAKIAGDDHALAENLEIDQVIDLKAERLAAREAAVTARETAASQNSQTPPEDPDAAAKAEFAASDTEDAQQARGPKKFADTEDGWREEFAATESLQDEFDGNVEDYVSFKKASKKGLVKIKNS